MGYFRVQPCTPLHSRSHGCHCISTRWRRQILVGPDLGADALSNTPQGRGNAVGAWVNPTSAAAVMGGKKNRLAQPYCVCSDRPTQLRQVIYLMSAARPTSSQLDGSHLSQSLLLSLIHRPGLLGREIILLGRNYTANTLSIIRSNELTAPCTGV